MTTIGYYWKDGAVVEAQYVTSNHALQAGLMDCPCVDLNVSDDHGRYGWFPADAFEDGHHRWVHYPLSSFPAEFRTHLLIMGVL